MDISGNELKAWILNILERESREFAQLSRVIPAQAHFGRQSAFEAVLREVWNMEDKLDKAIDQDYRDGKFN